MRAQQWANLVNNYNVFTDADCTVNNQDTDEHNSELVIARVNIILGIGQPIDITFSEVMRKAHTQEQKSLNTRGFSTIGSSHIFQLDL